MGDNMKKAQYYDGLKLLNKNDLDNLKPEIFICTGNRAAGKSYFFKRFLVQNFIKDNDCKFMVIFRKADEMSNSIGAFFEDIKTDKCFSKMKAFDYASISEMRGAYQIWTLNGVEMAYCTYLNAAEKIKRASSRFIKTKWIFFDEMQSEVYAYVENEVSKFISIHTSVARGQGEQSRYLPCILVGNSASLANPYFEALGISERFVPQAKFIRGKGWVAEFTQNESAKDALNKSRFNVAFEKNKYIQYATENTFLLDYTNFVERVALNRDSVFVYHFIVSEKHIGLWYLDDMQIFYFCSKYDPSTKPIALSKDDHTKETYYMLVQLDRLKQFFDRGGVRFETLEISNLIIDNLIKI